MTALSRARWIPQHNLTSSVSAPDRDRDQALAPAASAVVDQAPAAVGSLYLAKVDSLSRQD